jgi:hypothetical protein
MKRLTPLSLIIVALACIVSAVIGFSAIATASGENPMQIFSGTDDQSVAEVWFPKDGMTNAQIGGGAKVRLATIIGSERAIAVACPAGFEPDEARTYIAEPYRLETVDGRYTPTTWVLRHAEFLVPTAPNVGQFIIEK